MAIGTSLPELIFEVAAIRNGEVAMAFGNILGSVVTNSTLILGLSVLFTPVVFVHPTDIPWSAILAYVLGFVCLVARVDKGTIEPSGGCCVSRELFDFCFGRVYLVSSSNISLSLFLRFVGDMLMVFSSR